MDFFFWMLLIAIGITIIGWLFWIVLFVWLAKLFMSAAERNVNSSMNELEALLQQATQQAGHIDPSQQASIAQMMTQAHLQMGRLNDLSRQRYETRMGDLMGMAGQAGISWSPPPY